MVKRMMTACTYEKVLRIFEPQYHYFSIWIQRSQDVVEPGSVAGSQLVEDI